jgi:hypothetical protein
MKEGRCAFALRGIHIRVLNWLRANQRNRRPINLQTEPCLDAEHGVAPS